MPSSLLALVLAAFPSQRTAAAPPVGWYELAPGRHALVTFGASGGLRLFDFERPAFDVRVGGSGRMTPRHRRDFTDELARFASRGR